MRDNHTSEQLFKRARRVIPGGVNSPARAFKAVGGTPKFIKSATGSLLFDEDGNQYLDFIGSWGPMILGHNHPAVREAVERQLAHGVSYGAPTDLEVEMAELVCSMVPSVDVVRMVNSGTEATMSAIRVARAVTGRDLIVKFEGCYHGHGDSFLSKAGSGMATLGEPTSPGVPKAAAASTLNARFNDVATVEALFDAHGGAIAAVICEPVVGNMGCVEPAPGFLEGLRRLCTRHDALLIFDEVMTGFRLARGGAQERYAVMPDLTTLGKVLGGGLPVGAYGGRRDFMKAVSPDGAVYQAGTLSGNPLCMAAGLAQLRFLDRNPDVYRKLEDDGHHIANHVGDHIRAKGYPCTHAHVGSMGTVFFSPDPVTCWDEASRCDTAQYARYFWHLLENGVYMPCAQFEAYFHSAAHDSEEIDRAAQLMCEALDAVFSG